MFFSRYAECVEGASGSKRQEKDIVHSPEDFSWACGAGVRRSGPFSFCPQFISYFGLIPEQEAKIRQICSSETIKSSSLGLNLSGADSPAARLDSVLKWCWRRRVRRSLITELEAFTSGTDEAASALLHTMLSFLTEEQTLTLLRFFREKERYEGVDVKCVGEE